MRETIAEIVGLQAEYTASNTAPMRRRGELIRQRLPDEIRNQGSVLRASMGSFGADADVQGKDNMGQMSRIPWVRWFSRERSPSATTGWYVVFLFHPDASGVSLCLSHGSTQMDGKALVNRSAEEVSKLMTWAASIVGGEFADDRRVRRGIELGTFDLAVAYQRTTVFSKFYPVDEIPEDDEILRDLVRFVETLTKLYQAQIDGFEPGLPSAEMLALEEEVERLAAPLRHSGGQGRGLSGAARKLVEYHAMGRAKEWLKANGFSFVDVSASDSCDFRASKGGQEWVVEVKGTTGGPGSILLTRNEITLHRAAYPRNVLLVVHGIVLADNGTKVGGGELLAMSPWQINDLKLKPICFEYKLD